MCFEVFFQTMRVLSCKKTVVTIALYIKKMFWQVLETVRLPLLSPYFLHDCVESLAVVRQNPECYQYVEEAKLYHLLPDRRAELSSERTKPRNSADTIEVLNQFIYFNSCSCFIV